MNKIKVLGLASLVVLGGIANAFAVSSSLDSRKDANGNSLQGPMAAASDWVRLSATGELLVCSGRCVLTALIMGTSPGGVELRVRNTTTAEASAALALRVGFQNRNTEPGGNPVRVPLYFSKGIVVSISPNASNGEEVTIAYQDLD